MLILDWGSTPVPKIRLVSQNPKTPENQPTKQKNEGDTFWIKHDGVLHLDPVKPYKDKEQHASTRNNNLPPPLQPPMAPLWAHGPHGLILKTAKSCKIRYQIICFEN